MQSKKDIYNQSTLDKGWDFSEKKEMDKLVKKNDKASVTKTLAFRRRIKELKRYREQLCVDFQRTRLSERIADLIEVVVTK